MKTGITILFLSILSIAGTAIIYGRLPEQIPLHWGLDGEIDRYGDKIFAFLTASIPLFILALMFIIPKIDPRRDNYNKHMSVYKNVMLFLVLFLIGLHWLTMAVSLGSGLNVPLVIKLFTGLLFIYLGNIMPVIRHNYTFGIRTPWTLANERVWTKTHRVGGYLFILTGIVTVILAFFDHASSFYIVIGLIAALVLFLFGYSLWLFRKNNFNKK